MKQLHRIARQRDNLKGRMNKNRRRHMASAGMMAMRQYDAYGLTVGWVAFIVDGLKADIAALQEGRR